MMVPSPNIVKNKTKEQRDWHPRVVAFLCKWCSYSGADPADIGPLRHEALIEIIRVPCSGWVDPLFLLKCFEKGADGVLVSGCSMGSCRNSMGNYHAQTKLETFRALLEFCGFDARRIHFSWTPPADSEHWAKVVDNVVSQVAEAGSFPDMCPIPDMYPIRYPNIHPNMPSNMPSNMHPNMHPNTSLNLEIYRYSRGENK